MFKIGDYIVYKRNVCKIKDIKFNEIANKEYYNLVPIDDESLTIDIPVENKLGNIRRLITKKDLEKIIETIPDVEILNVDDKNIETEYKTLLLNPTHENLIKIIKTTYLRNKNRLDNNKKISEKDNNYFLISERMLYNEFSIILNMNYEDTKNYVIDKVMEKI